jgi:hypothetical protein
MRFRTPELFLGAFLAVAIFAMGMLFASSRLLPSPNATPRQTVEVQSLWVPTDSVGLYTLVLAAFTALLVVVSGIQGYFLLRADKTARIAANAAQLSAESAHGLALPIIGAESPELLDTHGPIPADGAFGGSSQGDLPGEFSAIPAIIFRNDGQTPAFPIKVVVEWRIGATSSDGNPRFKIYKYSSAIIPRGGEWESEICYEIQIPEGERTILRQKGNFLWLRVTLFYRDFLKKERAVIFRWRWDNPGDGMYFFESEGTRATQYQQGEETA